MSALTIHIEPSRSGRWRVRDDDVRVLSEHDSATEAERAAQRLARLERTTMVLLHDRYSRVRALRLPDTATLWQ